MRKQRTNRKAMLLFISLILCSFSIVKTFGKTRDENKPIEIVSTASQECKNCVDKTGVEQKIVPEESKYQIVYLDESQTVDISDKVKGEVKGSSCAPAVNDLGSAVREICTGGSGEIDFSEGGEVSGSGGGVLVRKDAQFELVQVTYPLSFWLGQYVYQNSNKEIKNTSPEYRSNGEQIDEEYVSKTLSPEEANEFRNSISGTVRENFSVEGKADLPEVESITSKQTGKYIVQNSPSEPKNKCPEEVGVSDYNVGKSNYIASDAENGGYLRQQIPGGDKYELLEDKACLEEGGDFKTATSGLYTACLDVVAIVKGWFSKTFGKEQWDGCTGKQMVTVKVTDPKTGAITEKYQEEQTVKSGECIDIENVAIKMAPIFGDPYVCTGEMCANAFQTYMYRGTLSPEQASGKVIASKDSDESLMFFVATKCGVTVDGKGPYDVLCLWDASQTLLNYKLQQKDKAPEQENFPSNFRTYWSKVENAVNESTVYYGL